MNASVTRPSPRNLRALLFLLLCLFLVVPDAVAQSRPARGGTSTGETNREGSRKNAPDAASKDRGTRATEPSGSGRTGESRSDRGRTSGTPAARERSEDADRNGRSADRSRDRDNRGRSDSDARRSGERDARDSRSGDRRDDRGQVNRPPIYVPPHDRAHDRPAVRYTYRRPVIRVDLDWPWEHRHRRGWAPRYQYRQVVYLKAGWARRHYDARLDVRTYYRHRVRSASPSRAEIDIEIDRIELYEDGYYLGSVDRIPSDLSRIRATVYRNGSVRFDRDVFVVGDPRVGFELVSTRHYGRFVLDAYDRAHGYRAGVLDLRRERVVPVRRSRLFDPYNFNGFVPISLLPDDAGWLFDYGRESLSGYYWGDSESYFYGRGGDASGAWAGDHQTLSVNGGPDVVEPLRRNLDNQFRSDRTGAEVELKREAELKRIE